MQTLAEVIKAIIDECPGIKGMELVIDDRIVGYTHILDTLERMVRNKEIVEVEYVLPTMQYRVKSIYFPAGTEVRQGTGNWISVEREK